jgi:hypothetical protein
MLTPRPLEVVLESPPDASTGAVQQQAFVGRCQVEQVAHLAGGHPFDVAEGDHGRLLRGQPDDGLSDLVERLGGDQALAGLLLPGLRDIEPVGGSRVRSVARHCPWQRVRHSDRTPATTVVTRPSGNSSSPATRYQRALITPDPSHAPL